MHLCRSRFRQIISRGSGKVRCYQRLSSLDPDCGMSIFMMYPIMVKIDFSQAMNAIRAPKPVILTLVINWLIEPFTMVVFSQFFLGWLFCPLIAGTKLIRGSEVVIANSYITGTILLGIAPCTAMALMWGYLSYGN